MNRMINIVLTDLASELLKHEEAMEITINSKDDDVNGRLGKVKYHLSKIVETELMIEKWRNYTSIDNEKIVK